MLLSAIEINYFTVALMKLLKLFTNKFQFQNFTHINNAMNTALITTELR